MWHDLRSRTKCKEAKKRLAFNGTGGGGPLEENLTNIEEDVLSIIKKVSIEGHNVPESQTVFHFNKDSAVVPQTEKPTLYEFVTPSEAVVAQTEIFEVCEINDSSKEQIPNERGTTASASLNVNGITKAEKKKMPKKVNNLVNSAMAALSFDTYLKKKIDLKTNYYKEKLTHMKNLEKLKAAKIETMQSIGQSLQSLVRKRDP